jgi:glycosyltransferase involved in cell wall biosynthesis
MLSKAINSLLEQTFTHWELIIIDDGSTDNTKEIINQFEDSRIKYFYQENAERSAARNNGIKHAIGQYICFIDSDDYYEIDRLQRLYTVINKKHQTVCLYYTGIKIKKEGSKEIIERAEAISPEINLSLIDVLYAMIHCQQVIAHKNVFTSEQFNETIRIGEDMELWSRIILKHKIYYLKNQASIVLVEHPNRTIALHKNTGVELLKTLHIIFNNPLLKNKIKKTAKTKLLSNCYFTIARHYIYQNNKYQAILNLLKSIAIAPFHPQTKHKFYLINQLILNKKTDYATH